METVPGEPRTVIRTLQNAYRCTPHVCEKVRLDVLWDSGNSNVVFEVFHEFT